MQPRDRIKWQIYYADSTYSSRNGSWIDAPASGVLFVVEFAQRIRQVHMGMDYYYMNPPPRGAIGDFLEVDMDDYVRLSPSTMKMGNWVSEEIWSNVHNDVFGSM